MEIANIYVSINLEVMNVNVGKDISWRTTTERAKVETIIILGIHNKKIIEIAFEKLGKSLPGNQNSSYC